MTTYRDLLDFKALSSGGIHPTVTGSRYFAAATTTGFNMDESAITGSLRPNVLWGLPYWTGVHTEHIATVALEVTAVGSDAYLGIYDVGSEGLPVPTTHLGTARVIAASLQVCPASIGVTLLPDRLWWIGVWVVASVTVQRMTPQQLPPVFGWDVNSGHALGVVTTSWASTTLPTTWPGSNYTVADSPIPVVGLR